VHYYCEYALTGHLSVIPCVDIKSVSYLNNNIGVTPFGAPFKLVLFFRRDVLNFNGSVTFLPSLAEKTL
jgi:hypothetical protein